jgi:hypothetical protein
MRKMNMGGSIPRQTTIQGQRHDLAYINPFEVKYSYNGFLDSIVFWLVYHVPLVLFFEYNARVQSASFTC